MPRATLLVSDSSTTPNGDAAASPSLAPEPTGQSLLRRILPKLLVSLLLGGVFAWIVVQSDVKLIPHASAFRHVDWWGVAAYALLVVVTHFFRASRWRFLIAPVKRIPLRDVIFLNWIGFFAIFAFPLRLGEFARPALTKLRNGVPVSAGLGTVAVERVVDGLIMSGCVGFALLFLPRLPTDDDVAKLLPLYGYLSVALFGCAAIALCLFLWQRDFATRLTERSIGIVSKKLGVFVASKVASMADGIRSITNLRLTAGFLGETAVYWSVNAFGMWVLAQACDVPMSAGHAVAIMGILGIGILLPGGPGLLGNFQLAIATGLRLYFAEALVTEEGSVYIFVMFVVQAVLITLLGLVPLYAMKIPFAALLRLPAATRTSSA